MTDVVEAVIGEVRVVEVGVPGPPGDAVVFSGTSTTTRTIASSGTVEFTTQSGKSWTPGQYLIIPSAADPTKYFHVYVVSYVGTQLVGQIVSASGIGSTFASWTINVSGPRGPVGTAGLAEHTFPDKAALESIVDDQLDGIDAIYLQGYDLPGDGGDGHYVRLTRDVRVRSVAVSASTVNVATNEITIPAHGWVSGVPIIVKGDAPLPGGLNYGATYFIVRVDDDTIQLQQSASPVGGGVSPSFTINITSLGVEGALDLCPYLSHVPDCFITAGDGSKWILVPPYISPEKFGALGIDGVSGTDDFYAWQAMVAVCSYWGHAIVSCRPGALYYWDHVFHWAQTFQFGLFERMDGSFGERLYRLTRAAQATSIEPDKEIDIIWEFMDSLVINMNQARIRYKGFHYRETSVTASRLPRYIHCAMRAYKCEYITIDGMRLDGAWNQTTVDAALFDSTAVNVAANTITIPDHPFQYNVADAISANTRSTNVNLVAGPYDGTVPVGLRDFERYTIISIDADTIQLARNRFTVDLSEETIGVGESGTLPDNAISVPVHGVEAGYALTVTGSDLPLGLVTATTFYAIPIDSDTIYLAFNQALSLLADLTEYSFEASAVTVNAPTTDSTITLLAHDLAVGQRVRLRTDGAAPGGLTAGASYFAIIVDADTIRLASSVANASSGTAVSITTQGTGTHLLERYGGHMVPYFFLPSAVNAGTNEITIPDHSIPTGRPVAFVSDDTPPGGLTASTMYFVISVDANTIQLAETAADATSGDEIDLTDAGVGNHSIERGHLFSTGDGTMTLTPVDPELPIDITTQGSGEMALVMPTAQRNDHVFFIQGAGKRVCISNSEFVNGSSDCLLLATRHPSGTGPGPSFFEGLDEPIRGPVEEVYFYNTTFERAGRCPFAAVGAKVRFEMYGGSVSYAGYPNGADVDIRRDYNIVGKALPTCGTDFEPDRNRAHAFGDITFTLVKFLHNWGQSIAAPWQGGKLNFVPRFFSSDHVNFTTGEIDFTHENGHTFPDRQLAPDSGHTTYFEPEGDSVLPTGWLPYPKLYYPFGRDETQSVVGVGTRSMVISIADTLEDAIAGIAVVPSAPGTGTFKMALGPAPAWGRRGTCVGCEETQAAENTTVGQNITVTYQLPGMPEFETIGGSLIVYNKLTNASMNVAYAGKHRVINRKFEFAGRGWDIQTNTSAVTPTGKHVLFRGNSFEYKGTVPLRDLTSLPFLRLTGNETNDNKVEFYDNTTIFGPNFHNRTSATVPGVTINGRMRGNVYDCEQTDIAAELALDESGFNFTTTTVDPADFNFTTLTFAAADVNVSTNQITIAGHGRATGDQVRVTTTGTRPAPISATATYHAIVDDANTLRLATTAARALIGEALDLTSQGVGDHTLTIGVLTTITKVAHGFTTGESARLATSGTAPAPQVVSATYYVIAIDADTFTFAISALNATNNVRQPIFSGGTGTHTYTLGRRTTISLPAHGLITTNPVRFVVVSYPSGPIKPIGISSWSKYFVIRLDDDTIQLATTAANATNGVTQSITLAGNGTYKMVSDLRINITYTGARSVTGEEAFIFPPDKVNPFAAVGFPGRGEKTFTPSDIVPGAFQTTELDVPDLKEDDYVGVSFTSSLQPGVLVQAFANAPGKATVTFSHLMGSTLEVANIDTGILRVRRLAKAVN